jgi:calcipressin-2
MAVDIPSPIRECAGTNTIIITSLSPPFFHPRVQAALRKHFECFGDIHTWAPLTGLGRIMVVYWNEDSVEGAKGLDGTVIGEEGQ